MTTKHAQLSNWRNELTPHIVDHLAKVLPDAAYALYPKSPTTYDEGFRTVTYKDLSNAVNGLAWWLVETLGRSTTFEVLAYIGPNDVRYTALLLAAVKAGYVGFFTSPRNSVVAHGALFDSLECKTLLTPRPVPSAVEPILKAHPMRHLEVPSVADLLDKQYPHFPYSRTFETAKKEPWVIIHTSGSTGIPKPLLWSHQSAASQMNMAALDPPTGFQSLDRLSQGKRMLTTFPAFHGAGILTQLCNSVPFGTVGVVPLSGAIPTAEGIVAALKAAPADVAFLVPSIAADLAHSPALLEYCGKNLELIIYAGGDLPQAMGDKIAAKVPIRCQYGASEIGLTGQLIAPEMGRMNWRWVRYHPSIGLDFEEVSPGLHELVVKRRSEHEANQATFAISPVLETLSEYRSKDLFEKHPSVPDCFGWRARADDIIVFLNGEKANPISMEHHVIARNQQVAAVLVIGAQKTQAVLLVEPASALLGLNTQEQTAFIESIWPSIEEANSRAPAHARIEKSMILLTSPEKPMVRSGKGTVQRSSTYAQYSADIDALYERADAVVAGVKAASIDPTNAAEVSRFIQKTIAAVQPELLQNTDTSFFELGMDSLMAMRIIRALRYGLGMPDLAIPLLHDSPTVQHLTKSIVQIASGKRGVCNAGGRNARVDAEFSALLSEYEAELGRLPNADAKNGEVVAITGSTGSLGTHILEVLLANPRISHVYCLNRRPNGREIHEGKANATGFPLPRHIERVTFLQTRLDKPHLGLDEAMYETLASRVTLIIHNAWPVNFLLTLKSFRSQFSGLTNLLALASSCRPQAKLLFVSSMSSVGRYEAVTGASSTPEHVIRDMAAPFPLGYAKSKLLAELLCDRATRTLDVPTAFARVGQIAGAVDVPQGSIWNVVEWLPSLVVTSITMGCLPDDLGGELSQIDWIPVNLLARSLVELGLDRSHTITSTNDISSSQAHGAEAFNVLGPRPRSWSKDILPCFVTSIRKHTGTNIQIVSLETWLARLRAVSEAHRGRVQMLARTHPAVKLLEFYEERMRNGAKAVTWELGRGMAKSETLKGLPAVGEAWIDGWVREWVAEMGRA